MNINIIAGLIVVILLVANGIITAHAEVMFESYIPGQKDYHLVADNLFKNKIDILYAG